ncbi:unnamed protein product [Sphagnum balticum]
MLQTPRANLEAKATLDLGIRSCLRSAVQRAGDDFSVQIKGNIGANGQISALHAESLLPPPLASCLETAFAALHLGSGAAGDFDMIFEKVRTADPHGKTFLLEWEDSQKLQ